MQRILLAAQPFCVHQRCIETRLVHQLANAPELLLIQRPVQHVCAACRLLITLGTDGSWRRVDKVFAIVGIAARELALHVLHLFRLKAQGQSRYGRLGLAGHRQQLAAHIWPHRTHLRGGDVALQQGLQPVKQIGIGWQLRLPVPGVQPYQLGFDLQALGVGEVSISVEIKIGQRGCLVVANFHGTAG